MILKINKIKCLGIFRDFKWNSETEDFCRYNLIYGWNGCGKTTLSKLFTGLDSGGLEKYPELEYEVETESGKYKQGQRFNEQIRVFNRDYVLANVEKIGGPNPIFILGDENKKIADQINKDEKEVQGRTDKLALLQSEKANLDTRRSNIFTDIARTISQNVSGESTRNYRKPNAEDDFSKLKNKQILSPDEVTLAKRTIAQQQKPKLDLLPSFESPQEILSKVIDDSKSLLTDQVTSIAITRLNNEADISEWVEKGVELHKNHSSTNCEFCNQKLPPDRLKDLANHFNDADKKLKSQIDEQLDKLRPIYATLRDLPIREESNLYDELQENYKKAVSTFDAARQQLIKNVESLGEKIKDKKSKTTEKIALDGSVDSTQYGQSLQAINKIIHQHNEKTDNFEKEKEQARAKLKTNYLSEIFDEVNKLDKDLNDKKEEIKKIDGGNPSDQASASIADLKQRITDNRSKISSSHKACKEINEKLETFLGHKELKFEVSGEGYIIKRHDEVADDLSEGERTAIAFVYFTVQLKEQNFNLKEGIVIIDDPVSSLDSNSMFQAFAFLKNAVKDAKQVFILTHNFEFMRQVKNWFYHIKKINNKPQRSFYMINNKDLDGKRSAYLAPLDKLLMDYESEYHYLFSLLCNFEADGSLEKIYNFPNIGRKFLETFLAFKIPNTQNLNVKMDQLSFDETKKTSILRFVHTHSHAARSDGVMNFDMTLTNGGQRAVTTLLEMIESVDETHFKALQKAITK